MVCGRLPSMYVYIYIYSVADLRRIAPGFIWRKKTEFKTLFYTRNSCYLCFFFFLYFNTFVISAGQVLFITSPVEIHKIKSAPSLLNALDCNSHSVNALIRHCLCFLETFLLNGQKNKFIIIIFFYCSRK